MVGFLEIPIHSAPARRRNRRELTRLADLVQISQPLDPLQLALGRQRLPPIPLDSLRVHPLLVSDKLSRINNKVRPVACSVGDNSVSPHRVNRAHSSQGIIAMCRVDPHYLGRTISNSRIRRPAVAYSAIPLRSQEDCLGLLTIRTIREDYLGVRQVRDRDRICYTEHCRYRANQHKSNKFWGSLR